MRIKIKNKNQGENFSKHQFDYDILVIPRKDEIVFVDPTSGAELGSLHIETMSGDKNEYINGYFAVFSNSNAPMRLDKDVSGVKLNDRV